MLIIGANVSRLIDVLTEANSSFQQGILTYLILFIDNVRQSQVFEWISEIGRNLLIESDETSKYTKHRSIVRNEWGSY